jgi:hypothetical protein
MNRAERRAAERRDRFYQEVGEFHNPGDANIARAQHFIAALGFTPRDVIVFDNLEPRKVVENIFRYAPPVGKDLVPAFTIAFYSDRAGLAVITREVNGHQLHDDNADIELTTVHELGHGTTNVSSKMNSIAKNIEKRIPGRRQSPRHFDGFLNTFGGDWLEEGFATLANVAYASTVQGKSDEYREAEVLMPAGAENFPPAYQLGALALDVLCTYQPKLWGELLESRQEPSSTQQVITTINGVKPGLFQTLNEVSGRGGSVGEQRAAKAFNHILEIGGHTKDDLPTLRAASPVIPHVQAKLDQYTAHDFSSASAA